MVTFSAMFWYWLGGLLLLFLPVELWAAAKTPTKTDTFSEFIWWVFGIKQRVCPCGVVDCILNPARTVRWARARRFVLAGMCVSLTAHLVFAFTFIPVAIFGAACGVIMVYAVAYERKRLD